MTNFRVLAGWEVHSYDADAAQIAQLAAHLAKAAAILPGPVRSIVQRAKIYVHVHSQWEAQENVMAFHWCTNYLRQNGRNLPDSPVAGSIEIHNISRLLKIHSQWLGSLVHELGHAFHYCLSSDADRDIKAAFEGSKDLPCYRRSRHIKGGSECVSYAVENDGDPRNFYKEYWACLFASYFDSNDYRPFNREALRTDDPVGYALIHHLITNP